MGILKIKKQTGIIGVFAVLIFSLLFSLLPTNLWASIYSDATDLNKKTAMYDYGVMLYGCYLQDDGVETNSTKVQNGQLFYFGPGVSDVGAMSYTPQIVSSVSDFGDDHYTYCGQNEGALTKSAFSTWGITSLDLVCEMGYKRDGQGTDCKQSTDRSFQAWGGINNPQPRANAFKAALKKLTGVDIDNPGDDVKYTYWRNYVVKGCTTGSGVPVGQSSVSGDIRYEIPEVSGTGETKNVYSGTKKKSEYTISGNRSNVQNNVTCGTALSNVEAAFKGYVEKVKESAARQKCVAQGYTNIPGGSFPGKSDLTACIQGALNKGATFCGTAYPDYTYQTAPISRDSERAACAFGQGQVLDLSEAGAQNSDTPAEGSTTCAVQGIGWMVCPVVNFLAGISDAIYGIIANFLEVKVALLSTNGGAYNAWTIMRNFANVFLVIAFLFIIYSQLTGVGVSNYGIKKTLPRLIIVAILMNISFFICQLAVDLSNILGSSLKGFLSELPVFKAGTGNWAVDTLNSGNFFTDMAVMILGGQIAGGVIFGIAAVGYFFGLGIFIPVIVAVIVAVLITFFILLARQMLIVVLIITAPIAFAMMLLPNTERWAKWWQKAFIALLIIYPAIAILFGGSQLAANILIQVNAADIGWQMAAAAIAIIPLFLVPSMLKGSLNAIPAIGNLAQKLQAKAVGSAAKGTAKGMKTLGEYSAAKGGRFGGISKALHGNGMRGRLRQASAKRAYEEPRMKDLMSQWTESDGTEPSIAQSPDKLRQIAEADPGSFKGQAALSLLASQGDANTLSDIRKGFQNNPSKMAAYSKAIASNYGALKAKSPSAVQDMRYERDAAGNVTKDDWAGLKQADLHTMKDKALKEGLATGSGGFRSLLTSAMQDPEQARHFTDDMYKDLGISRPTTGRPSVPTTASAPTSPGSGSSPQTPTPTATQAAPSQSAADAAREVAQQAAQGSAGTTPFTVSGSGEVVQDSAAGRARAAAASAAEGTSGEGLFTIDRSGTVTPPEVAGTPAAGNGSTTDSTGAATPNGATEDYNDRIRG